MTAIAMDTHTLSPSTGPGHSPSPDGRSAKEAKLRRACKDFEAILIKQLLTTMRKSVPKDGLFGGGFAEDIYQDMRDEQLARSMAHGQGIGIADAMFEQLSRNTHLTIEDIKNGDHR